MVNQHYITNRPVSAARATAFRVACIPTRLCFDGTFLLGARFTAAGRDFFCDVGRFGHRLAGWTGRRCHGGWGERRMFNTVD